MNVYIIIKNYVSVDNFLKIYNKSLSYLESARKPTRQSRLTESEIITIRIGYFNSGYHTFKDYYNFEILECMKSYFPDAVSYNRFIELEDKVIDKMNAYLQYLTYKNGTMYNYIDSTKLSVCHNKRIPNHKVFQDIASRGKSTMGWFYGFKLHFIINEKGDLVDILLTSGNVHDTQAASLMNVPLQGFLFGDKGYLSKKNEKRYKELGVEYVTYKRSNMKDKRNEFYKYINLKKRSVIESSINILKNKFFIEHTRHRSLNGFKKHVLGGLIAYQLKNNKPKVNLEFPFLEQNEGILMLG